MAHSFSTTMSIKHPVLAIMSPAKSLKSEKDILSITTHLQPTRPVYSAKADGLAALLKKKKAGEIAASMKISAALAKGVSELFEQYQIDAPSEGYQAALLYDGPAYRGLQYEELTQAQCKKAQKCVRFISGLYGVLKPSDCIQPYRLEMSMKPSDMGLSGAKSLSAYWCEDITREINATLGDKAESILLNVASEVRSVLTRQQSTDSRLHSFISLTHMIHTHEYLVSPT